MSEKDEITVHVLAQIRLDEGIVRIPPIRIEHRARGTLQAVIKRAVCKLRYDAPSPKVSLQSDRPETAHNALASDDLCKLRLSQLVSEPSKELSIIAEYDAQYLDRFLHVISQKVDVAADEGTSDQWLMTSADEAMGIVITHFDAILPDAHGVGTHLVSDIRRFASATGDGFIRFLPALMPQLVHVIEHGSDTHGHCDFGICAQKKAARTILKLITSQFGRSMAPFMIHLETLTMRLLCFEDDASWAAGFMPSLLACHKQLGGVSSARSLWTEYWVALKNEIAENSVHDQELTADFIDSVGDCIGQLGAEGLTGKELDEIASMLERELAKIVRRDAGNKEEGDERDHEMEEDEETVEEKGDEKEAIKTSSVESTQSMSSVDDNSSAPIDEEEEWLLKSAARLILTGSEVIGSPFIDIVRPLMPSLYSCIEKWPWGVEVIECLSAPAEMSANSLSSSFPAANSEVVSSSDTSSSEESDSDSDETSSAVSTVSTSSIDDISAATTSSVESTQSMSSVDDNSSAPKPAPKHSCAVIDEADEGEPPKKKTRQN